MHLIKIKRKIYLLKCDYRILKQSRLEVILKDHLVQPNIEKGNLNDITYHPVQLCPVHHNKFWGKKRKVLTTVSIFKISDKHSPLHNPDVTRYGTSNGEFKM